MFGHRGNTPMDGVGRVTAELTFLPRSEGGRNNPPMPPWSAAGHSRYLPHLVVEGRTDYLGVRFVCGPQPVFSEAAVFELELMYPGVDYSLLVPGVAVTVREGGRIVARGRVLERV
jgi:hypothetical protein